MCRAVGTLALDIWAERVLQDFKGSADTFIVLGSHASTLHGGMFVANLRSFAAFRTRLYTQRQKPEVGRFVYTVAWA